VEEWLDTTISMEVFNSRLSNRVLGGSKDSFMVYRCIDLSTDGWVLENKHASNQIVADQSNTQLWNECSLETAPRVNIRMEARCFDDIDIFIIFTADKDAHCVGNHQLLNASSTKRSSTYTAKNN